MLKSPEQMGGTPERKEGEPKKRIVSIEGGGDWADASYELLEVPPDLDLTKEKAAYDQWYREKYLPVLHGDKKIESKTFVDWLKEHGAKDSNIERFEE